MGWGPDSLVGDRLSLKHRLPIAAVILLLLASSAMFAQQSGNGLIVEVTDDAGRPLKYACVTVIPKEGEIIFRKADKSGKVKLKGIAPGNYRVVAKVEGYEAQKRQVTIGAAFETVAFALQPRRIGEE